MITNEDAMTELAKQAGINPEDCGGILPKKEPPNECKKTKKDKSTLTTRDYSNRILKDGLKIICDKYGRVFVFQSSSELWIEDGIKLIEQKLRKNYLKGSDLNSHQVREVIDDLKSLCLIGEEFSSPSWTLIPFDDLIYDLDTGETAFFFPEFHFTSKLAVEYNPKATCPTIDRIFHELVPAERVIDLYEMIAYCFIRAYHNQIIFFLYGSGANGKGVFTYILQRVLGKKNTSSVSLNSLQHDRFSAADLHQKLANICPELRYEELRNTDLVKKLCGGDYVRAERKYGHPFEFRNYAKLIFITNSLPSTFDKTHGFYRRIFLIEFPNTFDGDKQDRLLLSKIPREEYEGLAYKCLGLLPGLREKGFAFTNQPDPKKVAEEYEELSNPLDTFLEKQCVEVEDGFIPKIEFKQKLTQWAKAKGNRVLNDKEIKIEMAHKGIEGHKLTFSGDRKNGWVGIQWRDDTA